MGAAALLVLLVILTAASGCTAPQALPTPPPTAAATDTPAPAPSATDAIQRVQVILIAVDDNGAAGDPIGCGDSAVAVERQVASMGDPLQAAYEALLAIRERELGESGLMTALYQSDLVLESASLAEGTAHIALRGTLMLGGVCDTPRAEAQLIGTALLVPGVQAVDITLNGQPLTDTLSLK